MNVKLPAAFCVFAAVGLVACGSGDDGAGNPDSKISAEQATAPIEGAPPELASIREQGNLVLDEGTEGYESRLGALSAAGVPVVVNKWASWCGPCRLEFPHFQSQAQKRGGEIAFLGVAANDSIPALETFLSELPLPYPSYYDPDLEIAQELGGPTQAFPSTAFYDSSGELVFTKPGVYNDEDDLAADIERYAR